MKKLLISLLVIICLASATEISHRIQALGADFTDLIPDYETDLYRNPQLLEQKIAGISYGLVRYEPIRPISYYGGIPSELLYQMPLAVIVLSRTFGIYGNHWVGYYHELNYPSDLPLTEYGWVSSTHHVFSLEDLWMLRMKNVVLNVYSDVSIKKYDYLDSYNYKTLVRTSEYFLKSQGSFKVRKLYDVDIKLGMGFFKTLEEMNDVVTQNQFAGIPSCRVGLYYRNATPPNRFTSWFVSFGGPMSQREISGLPYSIYTNLRDDESDMRVIYCAKTFMSTIGWAQGIPLKNESFVALGFRHTFLYQRGEDAEVVKDFRAITSTISFPVGVEFIVNRIALRFGTLFSYNFESTRDWYTANADSLATEELHHTVRYDYSFGFGWRPTKWLVIDLYNTSYLSTLQEWSIYVKYLF